MACLTPRSGGKKKPHTPQQKVGYKTFSTCVFCTALCFVYVLLHTTFVFLHTTYNKDEPPRKRPSPEVITISPESTATPIPKVFVLKYFCFIFVLACFDS